MAEGETLRTRFENDRGKVRASHSRWLRYGPLVLWAVLIFIGSGDILSSSHTSIVVRLMRYLFPNASPETLGLFHLLVRKAGHVTEYAILALLAARAFQTSSIVFLRRQWFWIALTLVLLYALSDEFHQSFVPSRGASIYDSLIDLSGGFLALAWLAIRLRAKQPVAAKA